MSNQQGLTIAMTDNINGSIGFISNISVVLPILGILAMVALALFVWNRTKSSYSLLNRLWQLFHGNKDCKDKEISEFLDTQSALMQFRFTTGIPIRTRKHARSIIEWSQKNNEDVSAISACGPYFDIENIKLKDSSSLPNHWLLFLRFIFSSLLLSAAIIFMAGTFFDSALMQVKKSRTYFTINYDYASHIGSAPEITAAQCSSSGAIQGTSFDIQDAKVICGLFNSKNFKLYIDQTVFLQRIIFCITALIVFYFSCSMFIWLLQGTSAWRMTKRLNKDKDKLQLSLTEETSTSENG